MLVPTDPGNRSGHEKHHCGNGREDAVPEEAGELTLAESSQAEGSGHNNHYQSEGRDNHEDGQGGGTVHQFRRMGLVRAPPEQAVFDCHCPDRPQSVSVRARADLRPLRVRTRCVSVRTIGVCLLVLFVTAGGAGAAGGSLTSEQRRVGIAGVTVALPVGWQAARPADGSVVDPLTRVAVSSGPLRVRRVRCQIARYAPTPRGVSLVVVEWERSDGQRGARPPRFTWRSLPLQPAPALECHDGAAGSVHFEDRGRVIGAYVLLGKDAPPALAAQARRVLETLRVQPRPAGVELVPLAPATLRHCRKALILRPACPRLVPRVRAPYLHHLADELLGRGTSDQLSVFGLERGGEHRGRPERNRPPRMGHLVVAAGALERMSWRAFAPTRATRLRDGLMRLERSKTLAVGRVRWSGREGRLFLHASYPNGGFLGNHLTFRWRENGRDYALSLHAWEPLRETSATLARIVASLAPAERRLASFGRPATFARLPEGWRQYGAQSSRWEGGRNAWLGATSWGYRLDRGGPLRRIPRDGVLIEVNLIRRDGFPHDSRYPYLRRLPLRLDVARVTGEAGAPQVEQRRLLYRYGRQYELDVRVDFGRRNPTKEMLRSAQNALNGLRLPKWVAPYR